jgi:precorrin-6Y C5,15-methyltransferase (decarboxylating)
MPSVTVVGTGVGPEDLTEAHREAIEVAEVLVGGKRQLAVFTGQSEKTWVLGANPATTLEAVKQEAGGKRVVILASGDPLFFGIGNLAVKVFGPERVSFLPNVTALQKTFARLKLPWSGARTISVHGRKPMEFFAAFADPGCIAIYTDPKNTPDRLAKLLLEFGMANRKVAVVEEIGSEEEQCWETDLATAAGKQFAPLNVMVLYPLEGQQGTIRFGLEDEQFRKEKSLITKKEARALILAELQIREDAVMWDVGAGSGSVGIEAVRIASGLRVYAVEREKGRLEMIRKNSQQLGGFGLRTVLGEAPEALQDLPDPDRVFVGGSGGSLADILEVVEKRLQPEGRAVVSVVTPETLGRALKFVEQTKLAHEWLLLQVSRTVPIESGQQSTPGALMSRFQPQTPLFLLSLWR